MKNPQSENNETKVDQNSTINAKHDADLGGDKSQDFKLNLEDRDISLSLDAIKSEISFWEKFPKKYLFHHIVNSLRTVESMVEESKALKNVNYNSSKYIDTVIGITGPERVIFHDSVFGKIIAGLKNIDEDTLAGIENELFETSNHQLGTKEYLIGKLFGATLKALSRSILIDNKITLNRISWFKKTYESLFENAINTKKKLEELYTEELMLREPATLWQQKAEKHGKSGNKFLWITVFAFIVVIAIVIASIFTLGYAYSSSDSVLTLKITVLITVLISFMGYGLHQLVKLTISSFHLKAEAEHKEQLTKLYLSLLQSDKIETTDRQIVLQSLFSNIDTGLIKSDNAPTTITPLSLFKSSQ